MPLIGWLNEHGAAESSAARPNAPPAPRGDAATPPAACDHCGLPVPAALFDASAEHQFCCAGCRMVHAMLRDSGLTHFYDIVDTDTGRPQTAKVSGRSFAEFDDEAFAKAYVARRPDGLSAIDLYLEGVHCSACVWLVERLPNVAPGVIESRLDFGRQMASVVFDPAKKPLSDIARLLDALGYTPHPWRGVQAEEMRRRDDRRMMIRMAVAGASAMNVMIIAFALYGGMFSGMEDEYRAYFRWTSLLWSLPALWAAGIFFRGALSSLRMKTLHMDVPVAVGLSAGFAHGVVRTATASGEVYFDSLTVLVFLLLVGRFLQMRRQRAAIDAAELTFALMPTSTRVVTDGACREVSIASLAPGDVVEVRAGESLPADGRVVEGESEIDLSLLTGETRPVAVSRGADVYAGAVNLAAPIRVEVTRAGSHTRIGRLMELVEEYGRRRAPITRLADKIAGVFVASVLGLALFTFYIWRADPGAAIEHAVALLIVTCPCALGLATPLAVSAAIGRAARRGILIKGGDVIERLTAFPMHFVFDKTGTLTAGKPSVRLTRGDRSTLARLAALETGSTHPVAQAIAREFANGATHKLENVSQRLGDGIAGRVDGHVIAAGTRAFVAESAIDDAGFFDRADVCAAGGLTPIVVARDGVTCALIGLGDAPKPGAAELVKSLVADGHRASILSGDHPDTVARLAESLGIGGDGGVSPEDKARRVASIAKSKTVVMVGDGVNDAAALQAASVGVAVHGGAEASLSAADVFFTHPSIDLVRELVDGARGTMRTIRTALAFSLVYNATGALLAIAGVLNPLIAALLMPASSLTVITIAYRSRSFREPRRFANRFADPAIDTAG
ncbi:heavy metal translocating P-type ATPase [bacterium]|nr:heavy metal translocating P-type ATPase [bacterium]